MKPQHLNYSRKARKALSKMPTDYLPFRPPASLIRKHKSLEELLEAWRRYLAYVLDKLENAPKFLIPAVNGILIEDKDFKGIDPTKPLPIPFDSFVIEYPGSAYMAPEEPGQTHSTKRIAIFDRDKNDPSILWLTPVSWLDLFKRWEPYPSIAIPMIGTIDKDLRSESGECGMYMAVDASERHNYQNEEYALLNMLNALNCSNVGTTISRSKKIANKGALPFDSYHILTIQTKARKTVDGQPGKQRDGRSPREHLRRGHIRRCHSGKTVWINSAVVNAGKGLPTVKKDYAIL